MAVAGCEYLVWNVGFLDLNRRVVDLEIVVRNTVNLA